MKTGIGEIEEIVLGDGRVVHGIVHTVYEDDTAWYIRYEIVEFGGKLPDGSSDPNQRYISNEYYYPKSVDTSHLEKGTGMPLEYAGKLYEDFVWKYYPEDISQQRKQVEQFLFKFKQYLDKGLGLYLTSKTKGSGKTMLACCLANELIRREIIRARFINIADYITVSHEEEALYKESTVLVIDDLGAQDEKHDWVVEKVYRLIDARCGNKLPTIITSNKPISSCSSEDKIVSRVERMAIEVKFPEVSIRKQLADRMKREFMESLT